MVILGLGMNMKKNNKTRLALSIIFSMGLSSCVPNGRRPYPQKNISGEKLTTSATSSGVFFDSAVKGLRYRPTKSTKAGTTNSDGGFICRNDEDVDFSIGKLFIGRSECKSLVTPKTMYPDSLSAVNLGMLLLALDENGNPDDGIKLPDAIQNQLTEIGSLDNIISDTAAVTEVAKRIIAAAPEKTFFGGGELSSKEAVRTHFDASIATLGRYSGAIGNLEISKPEGYCNYTRTLTVEVKSDAVTISGFGAFTDSEASFTLPRKLNSKEGRSHFDGILELPRLERVEVLGQKSGRIYDQIRFSESIIEEDLFVKYEAGNVNNDGSFDTLCSGSIKLVREVKLDDFMIMRKRVVRLASTVGSIFGIVSAADYSSTIYTKAIELNSTFAPNLAICILEQNNSHEVKANCTELNNEMKDKANHLANLIIRQKAINPLISDDLISLITSMSAHLSKLDGLFSN